MADRRTRRQVAQCVLAASLLQIGCSSGSGSLSESHTRFAVSPLAVQTVESSPGSVTLHARVAGFRPGDSIYYRVAPGAQTLLSETRPLTRSVQDAIEVALGVREDLDPGTYTETCRC